MSAPHFPVELDDAGATVECVELPVGPSLVGALEVTPVPLNHPQGCTAFRLDSGTSRVVYATDHEPGDPAFDEPLRAACAEADLLVVDAQYTPAELERRRGWGHGSWEFAVDLAREAGVERVLLFHHDPEHDDRELTRIADAARERHPGAELAREGAVIRL